MERLARGIGLDTPGERIAELAEAAGLEQMRSRADELAPNTKQILSNRPSSSDPATAAKGGSS